MAYADLLAEAGRPTLVIRDDVLAHREAECLAQMKHGLFDAPTRHQTPRVRQLRSQVLVLARAHFQKCHYNSANCSGAAGFSIPNA